MSIEKIIVLDDDAIIRKNLEAHLRRRHYDVAAVGTIAAAQEYLGKDNFDIVFVDVRLPDGDGTDLLKYIQSRPQKPLVVMMTGFGSVESAVECMKNGAFDYLIKPFSNEQIEVTLRRAGEFTQLLNVNRFLSQETDDCELELLGRNPVMENLRQLIRKVARTQATVLIQGESGTGKELVAGAIHSLSPRRDKHYVRINCAAIPETLLESELFGHEKGSFTGAIRQKHGRVEDADGGTIFLDEIADMGKPLQAKLLRFLEDGSFTRVGGTEELRVNVRLIAATNRDITQAIADGEFREDLFHRLNVVQFNLPPLRERGEDILILGRHFLKVFRTRMAKNIHAISPAAQAKLLAQRWPGNVRELRNVIERALILETGPEIQTSSLPDFAADSRPQKGAGLTPAAGESLDEALERLEREIINNTLEQSNFSLTRTAERLRMTRHSLRYRMQKLNMKIAGDSADAAPSGPGE